MQANLILIKYIHSYLKIWQYKAINSILSNLFLSLYMFLFVDKSWGRKKLEQVRVSTSFQQWPDWGMTCVSCSFSEALCVQRKFTPFTLTVINYILPVPFIMKMYMLPVPLITLLYLYYMLYSSPGTLVCWVLWHP